MVVEKLFQNKWIERRSAYSLFIGVILTLLAFGISFFLFRSVKNFIGISTVLFTVIISVPLVNKLLSFEEKVELTKANFFRKHEAIIDFYVYFFIGVFIVLFEIAIISPNLVFSQENLYGATEVKIEKVNSRLPRPPAKAGTEGKEIISIFKNNFYVMLLALGLSLFYGSGALFLIILNASIFASALAKVVHSTIPHLGFLFTLGFLACNLGIMFFHMIPEVLAYLLAAIAGGVVSQAILTESIKSENFKIILKDSAILIGIATIVLYISAIIEHNISRTLINSNICKENNIIIILIFAVIFLLIVAFEFLRKKRFALNAR